MYSSVDGNSFEQTCTWLSVCWDSSKPAYRYHSYQELPAWALIAERLQDFCLFQSPKSHLAQAPTQQGAAVPRQELVPLHSASYPAVPPIPKAFSRLWGKSILLSLAHAELTGEASAELCVCFWVPSLPAELAQPALTVHLFEVHREQAGQSLSK